jgi:hypothetical protein
MKLLAALTLVALAVGCGDDDSGDDVTLSDDAVIEYHFGDSSVPPEVHRSYTLTIDRTEVHAVVDSYGDLIGEDTVPLPDEVWTGLADNLDAVTDLDVSDDDDGCSGGTSRELTITDGDDEVVDVAFSVCGGSNESAAGELDDYVAPVIDAFPDWESLFDQQ